jgi:flavin reductase (DIM6/NTAB) family NADH-FMN oxidoreductase RutF
MVIDPRTLSAAQAYRLMIACLVPRPIAWLSTLSAEGTPNLAPFSYFGGVSSHPPIVSVSIGRRRGGGHKDSAANLLATGEGVVHIVDRAHAVQMVATSADVGPEVDEFALAGIEKVESLEVEPWRIKTAPIAMEAIVERHLEVGHGPVDLFLLEVVCLHLDERVLVDGLPDPERLAAVGRLGGESYCQVTAPFRIPRP